VISRPDRDIEAGNRKPTWDDAVKLIEACGGEVTIQKPNAALGSAPEAPRSNLRSRSG
jgi:hypothetical protein